MIPYDDPKKNFTQNVILSAYLTLAEEGNSERITVRSICERAEINRSTFYHYFDDLNHLEEEVFTYHHDLLFRQVDEAHQKGLSAKECMKLILENVMNNKSLCFLLLKPDFQPMFSETLMNSFKRALIRTKGPTGPEYDLRLAFAFNGGLSAVRYYITHPDSMTLEEAADLCFRLFRDAMKWPLPRDEKDIPLPSDGYLP